MKRTPVLFLSQYLVNGAPPKNGRRLTRKPFPYTGDLPLSLRNEVIGKGSSEVPSCLYELASLLACLKENEFAEKFCLNESNVLRSCHEKTLLILFGRDVSKIPCFRNTFIYSISSGIGVGLLHFMFTSKIRKSCNIGFGAYIFCVIVYWPVCRYNYSLQKFQLGQIPREMLTKEFRETRRSD